MADVYLTAEISSAIARSLVGSLTAVDWNTILTGELADTVVSSVEGEITIGLPGDNRLTRAITNRGKKRLLELFFLGTTEPTVFRFVLCTDNPERAYRPSQDTKNISELRQIVVGNGYSNGGEVVYRNSTGFPALTEDDSLDEAVLLLKSVTFTAISGNLPKAGDPIYYGVLVDQNGVVIAYHDLSVDGLTIPEGQTLALQNIELKLV